MMLTRLTVVALLAGVAGAWYALLPPRAGVSTAVTEPRASPVRGAIHVHSLRSDGTGDMGTIAAAAARAGLDFVILTDHGDATRPPDPPQYLEGVLCIDAVELSTDDGHVVALDLPRAPYPLGGEARDVLDDISRLGAFSIAAHPGSPRAGLRWSAGGTELDGLEWLNADSEWRDESVWSLARAVLTYPIRGTETLVSLLDRPTDTLGRWDVLSQRRRVVALAGSDAHARIGFRSLGEPYDGGSSLHVPSYERMFQAFSNALPDITLSGDAVADAQLVLAAIREGHVYSTIDGLGGAAVMSFTAASGAETAMGGDTLPLDGPVTLRVEIEGPDTARIDLLKDGRLLQTSTGTELEREVDAIAAVYRVEVVLPASPGDPPVPWIVSNPIYVGREVTATVAPNARSDASGFAVQYENGPASDWTIETSPASLGALDVVTGADGMQLSLRYGLGGAASDDPFVALVMPAGQAVDTYDRLMFTAGADRPMRLSVQLRQPDGEAGERWHRSVYLDSSPRTISVFFDDLRASGVTSSPSPVLDEVEAVLFVVDTVNTPVGASGTLWIDDVRYGR
jgi:hypothetical protein